MGLQASGATKLRQFELENEACPGTAHWTRFYAKLRRHSAQPATARSQSNGSGTDWLPRLCLGGVRPLQVRHAGQNVRETRASAQPGQNPGLKPLA
jgi:hypothetical protein